MASETWVFSKEKFVTSTVNLMPNTTDPMWAYNESMVSVMAYLSAFVVDGPIDIDWQDRYGWTSLSMAQIHTLLDQASKVLSTWADEWTSGSQS